MYIQYYGLGSFRITTTNLNILIDPLVAKSGLSTPRGQADILLLTSPWKAGGVIRDGVGHVVDRPGEMDIGGCSIVGLPCNQTDGYHTVFWLEVDNVKLLFVGKIKEWRVDADDLSGLGDIDVVVVPVGGGDVMDYSVAARFARSLEARLVIPSYFALPGLKAELASVDKFLKEMNSKSESTDRLKVTAKDLPQDNLQVQCIMPSKI